MQPRTDCAGVSNDGEVVSCAEPAIADGEPGSEDEVFPATKSADHPAQEIPERHNHGKNLTGTVRIELFSKLFILAGVRRFGETQVFGHQV